MLRIAGNEISFDARFAELEHILLAMAKEADPGLKKQWLQCFIGYCEHLIILSKQAFAPYIIKAADVLFKHALNVFLFSVEMAPYYEYVSSLSDNKLQSEVANLLPAGCSLAMNHSGLHRNTLVEQRQIYACLSPI